MSITRRFILLPAVGLIVLAISIYMNSPLTVFVIYNIVCFGLLVLDYLITPDATALEINRLGEDKLSLFEREAIAFEVYNKGSLKLGIELKDEVPEFHFEAEGGLMKAELEPHSSKTLKYDVTPTKRGAFSFGSLHIRLRGRLGLCQKIFKLRMDREYRVYPNMKNLRKYRLGICNNRRYQQGQRNLRMLGRGTSFESLREYVHGDEYRRINWKATARGNKPIVNQYEPEKNQHVYLFLDIGRPMSYTIRGNRKLDMAVNTALVLSDLINQNGDQSALLLFNTKVEGMIMPGKGATHRNKIMETLYHIEGTRDTSNYDEAFFYFKKKERHRSIVFIFTDFDTVEEAEEMLRVLPVIAKNNIVVILLMENEGLKDLSHQGIKDKESIFTKGVAMDLLEERRRIIHTLNHRGILCVECPAEKLEYTAINKYISIKNRTYL